MKQTFIHLLFVLFAVAVLNQTCQAQQTKPAQPDMHAIWKTWRDTMKRTAYPSETGCFKASYPSTAWTQTACVIAPLIPYPPAHGARPYTVGNGTDYYAQVANSLSSVTGSFPTVSGLSSASAYSLQLNAKPFSTSVCDGAVDPSECQGWQQFLYIESPSETYIQYWLLNWGSATCPSGWMHYDNDGQLDCYKNSSATDAPVPQLASWAYLEVVGGAASGTDKVTFYDGGGNVSASASDSILNLEQVWYGAEFNAFGNGNGSEVSFNSGASFVVQTSMDDGSTTAPSCESGGFTGETNNLSLVGSCCPVAGTYGAPYTQFLESNNSIASAACGTTGVAGNFAPTPSSSGTYTSNGYTPPEITFTETLSDSNPNAEIDWTVPGCAGSTSGDDPLTSGESFTLVYQSGSDSNPSGTMYATASGDLASPVTSIDFP
ncbi:MAG: hypothetical protein ACRD28_05565 [Acidobacteriaceae bacterium]